MATFYLGQSSKDSKWYFRLRDSNNEIILASTEGYNSRQGCLDGISSVKAHSPHDRYYTKFPGNDGKHYFTLKAANNEPIGRSEGYNSSYSRDIGIENCKKEAPTAPVKELTAFT